MKKRLFMCNALIILALVVTMFAGCKKDDSGSSTATNGAATTGKSTQTAKSTATSTAKTTASAATSTPASTATTTLPEAGASGSESKGSAGTQQNEEFQFDVEDDYITQSLEEKKIDLKGRVIKLLYTMENQKPVADSADTSLRLQYKYMTEAEKLFNCKFEFEFISGSWASINKIAQEGIMAGVYFADVFRGQDVVAFPTWEKNNIILPIDEYVDYSMPVFSQFTNNVKGIYYPDRSYVLRLSGETGINGNVGTWWNKDIFAREGLKDIHELVKEDNWNWNTFLELAIAATKDINGDGVVDQYGITATPRNLGANLINSNGAPLLELANGKYQVSLSNIKTMTAMQFMSDLYNVYKVAHPKTGTWTTNFVKGEAAMVFYEPWNGSPQLKSKGMTNLGFDRLPFGPNNTEKVFYTQNAAHNWYYPSNLANPQEVLVAMAYWLNILDDSRAENIDIEQMYSDYGSLHLYSNEDLEALKYINRNITYIYDPIRNFDPIFDDYLYKEVFNKIVKMETPTMSAIESIKVPSQVIIDEKMGY